MRNEQEQNRSDRRNILNIFKELPPKALALMGAGALLATSLTACGGDEKAGADPGVTTDADIENLESGYNKTEDEYVFHKNWIDSLSAEEKADYDRLSPDNIANMSLEEITDEFKIPKNKILDESGDISLNKTFNQYIIHLERGRNSFCSKEVLEKQGIIDSSGDTVYGITQEDRGAVEDKYMGAASGGFIYNDNNLASTNGSMVHRCERAIGMGPGMGSGIDPDGQPQYEQFVSPESKPNVIPNTGSSELTFEFDGLWEDTVDPVGMSLSIGSDPEDPGQTGRLNSPIKAKVSVYFDDEGNVRFSSDEEHKYGGNVYEYYDGYDKKLVNALSDGTVVDFK